jgi:hypothetical protein
MGNYMLGMILHFGQIRDHILEGAVGLVGSFAPLLVLDMRNQM